MMLSVIDNVNSLRMNPVNYRHRIIRAGATATDEQSKSGIGWDSHKAIDSIPDSLVRTIDGNDSMRRKFELLCRTAQVKLLFLITKS